MQSLTKILVPIDFSDRSLGAARYAKALAGRFQSEITLLHVITPLPYEFGALEASGVVLTDIYRDRAASVESDLRDFMAAELAEYKVKRILREGDAAGRIVEYAHADQTDLIVMPTHGHGAFRRFILGSNTAKVLHDAACPVWTGVHLQETPGETPVSIRRVLCAIDLGPQTCHTLEWAALVQRAWGASLSVIHAMACHDEAMVRQLENTVRFEVERFEQRAGVQAEVLLDSGDASKVVCDVARRVAADVLVIGRGSAAGGFGRLRTHAYAMIRQSPCPVVSV